MKPFVITSILVLSYIVVISSIAISKVDLSAQVDPVLPSTPSAMVPPAETIENSMTLPKPQVLAIGLMQYWYDITDANEPKSPTDKGMSCAEGNVNIKIIKDQVLNFLPHAKSLNGVTALQAAEIKQEFQTASLAIRDAFTAVYESTTCNAIIKAGAKHYRRGIFLMSLKYDLGIQFYQKMNVLIGQDIHGEQVQAQAIVENVARLAKIKAKLDKELMDMIAKKIALQTKTG